MELARVGLDPAGLALAPDGAAFVSARGSAQVFRVSALGTALVSDARGAPGGVVSDGHAGAIWTVPTNDSLVGWDFGAGAPAVIASTPRPAALLRVDGTLYIVGDRSLQSFVPGDDAAPRTLSNRCSGGAPALDGTSIYCAEEGSIVRVDTTTGMSSAVADGQSGALDVVAAGGRAFWRSQPTAFATTVMALPLDGIGGPTVFEESGPGPLTLALDSCDLYFSAGTAIVRVAL
jgi:hypothetical protein